MDNCSHNGDRLKAPSPPLLPHGERGYVMMALSIIFWTSRVSASCTMIDKITPRPDPKVASLLAADRFDNTECIVTSKHTYIAPFVTQKHRSISSLRMFPAGRPPLERVGVIFTDRETVDKAERMKVCTCLNPLHTALAVFGCLSAYSHKRDEKPRFIEYGSPSRIHRRLTCRHRPRNHKSRAFIDEVVNVPSKPVYARFSTTNSNRHIAEAVCALR